MPPTSPRAGSSVIGVPGGLAPAGVSYPFTGSGRWRLVAVSFVLSTSVAVAARRPVLALLDSTGAALAAVAAPFTLSAGKVATFTFAAGLQPFGANDAAQIGGPFVGGELPPNVALSLTVGAADAADALGAVRLTVCLEPYREPAGAD